MTHKLASTLLVTAAALLALGTIVLTAQDMPGPGPMAAPDGDVEPPAAPGPTPEPTMDDPEPGADGEILELDESDAETGFLSIDDADAAAGGGDGETAGRISITLDDVEIVDVVRMFTRISGANIIATPSNLQGRVTVNLTEVEWRPALESILDMHGLALEEKLPGSSVYSVVPRPAGTPDPMKVETFFLKYATVDTVEPVVKGMLTSGASVTTFPSQNALVVRSTAANLGEISQVVEQIDIAREQVFIEAKFMELNDEAIKDLGINWQVLQNYALGASSLQMDLRSSREWTDSRTDTVTRRDNRGIKDTVDERFDIYNDQYQEETLEFLESPPDSGNFISQTKVTPTRTTTDSIDVGRDVSSEISDVFTRSVSDVRTAVLGAADFQIVLSALQQMNGVSIVSNPKIIVANEEPAKIHIGQTERPFVSSVTPGQQGIAPVVTYNPGEAVDTGVKLTVTPTVNTESNITVRIEPELTRFLRDAVAPNGQTYPIIGKKTITTVFSLESGKTVAIGGLTETLDQDVTSKIPLLGDLPLIGKYLFSHTHRERSQTETIIFVTVGLATPGLILRETGLPEDTELARRHIIATETKRRAVNAEIDALSEAAEEERLRDLTEQKSRLLQRSE